jgi:hypothetical protein
VWWKHPIIESMKSPAPVVIGIAKPKTKWL